MARRPDTVHRKLMIALMGTSVVVLVITCAVFMAYGYLAFRKDVVRGLVTRGEIIAANSTAALAFQNEADARGVLSAFRMDPHIVAACLYDQSGHLFARYPADAPAETFPSAPGPEGGRFEGASVVVSLPVAQGNRRLGTVYLKSDLSAMTERGRVYALLGAFAVASALVVAFLLSGRLQRRISEPILDLARTARMVSEQRNYALRARKRSDDEIGQLTDSFNDMLAQIQERDAALQKTQEEIRKLNLELEQRVVERTEQLEESRGHLASVLESLGEGVVVADRDGKFVLFNPAAQRILGMGATEAAPGDWPQTYGVFRPDGVTPSPADEQPLLRAIRGESCDDVELFIRNSRTPEGVAISVSGRPIHDAGGAIRGGVIVFRDITERKRSTEALRQSEERFRLMLDNVKDYAILMLDPEGRVTTWNEGAERIKGYGAREIIGQHFSRFYPPEEIARGKPEKQLRVAAAEGRVEDEGWRVRKDGSRFWADVILTVLRDEHGTLRGFGKVTRDITERKQAERSLAERSVQLEAANKELESFAYSVSHDLRAPLRSIDGFSQILLEDFAEQLGSEGQRSLTRIRAATQRMGHLIDDLLKLSQVTRVEIRKEQVDLSSLARQVATDVREREPERRVAVDIAEGIRVEGDPRLLGVVLENLIGNAFKFTEKKAEARIEFGTGQDGGRPLYFVRDNGAGFDMTYAGKLFGAFQRLHSAEDFRGTGIGLATVQRIIHRHGGRVWAEGAVGQGATFYFTL